MNTDAASSLLFSASSTLFFDQPDTFVSVSAGCQSFPTAARHSFATFAFGTRLVQSRPQSPLPQHNRLHRSKAHQPLSTTLAAISEHSPSKNITEAIFQDSLYRLTLHLHTPPDLTAIDHLEPGFTHTTVVHSRPLTSPFQQASRSNRNSWSSTGTRDSMSTATDEPYMPGSPPELSSSTSSKSSSLHSANEDDEINNIAHFEDISLEDVPSTLPPQDLKTSSRSMVRDRAPRPLLSTSHSLSALPEQAPHLSPYYRSVSPGLARSPRYAAEDFAKTQKPDAKWQQFPAFVKSQPSPARLRYPPAITTRYTKTALLLPIGPSLAFETVSAESILDRTCHAHTAQTRLMAAVQEENRKSSRTSAMIRMKRYREDAIVWNIPLSPRPPEQRQPPKSPNPESRSGGPKSGDLKAMKRPKPDLARTRTKSWTAALSDLSQEAKELTTALESYVSEASSSSKHSSELDKESSESDRSSTIPSRSKGSKRPVAIALPPLQRGNALVDPLPISKEKEKFLCRTRPSWLPPKCPKEEKKHLKQYQSMMASFLDSEKRKTVDETKSTADLQQEATSLEKLWIAHILPNFPASLQNSSKARELWWRGVPASLRSRVWQTAISNDLHLSAASYAAALTRAQTPSSPNPSIAPSRQRGFATAAMTADIASTFPEAALFQLNQPLHDALINVLSAYSAYRSDIGYVPGTSGIAALLLSVIHDESATFTALANLLNRPLSLAFCLDNEAAMHRVTREVMRGIAYKMPRLAERLRANGTVGTVERWVAGQMRALFTGSLELKECLRVWDVLVFEGESGAVRAAVGIIRSVEGRLHGGDEEEVRTVLENAAGGAAAKAESRPGEEKTRIGEEKVMENIRWAGKAESEEGR